MCMYNNLKWQQSYIKHLKLAVHFFVLYDPRVKALHFRYSEKHNTF